MSATLAELAERFGCELDGRPDRVVERVAPLHAASPQAISFLANPRLRERLVGTRAGAVILERRFRSACPTDALISPNPYATYARIAAFLHPPPAAEPGVHASAVIASGASVASSAQIGAHVCVGEGARIGERVVIGPGCVVGAHASIGADSRLIARVTVLDRVRIGARCLIHPGAVIGADGFGFALDRQQWVKVPQLGSVVIGDDVEIGANTTVDRGALEDTVLEDGVKLDNLVQIAHNVHVGAHTVMAATAGIAGSTRIGRRCMFAGGAAAIGHLTICDDVVVTVRGLLTQSVDTPGTYSGILPAGDARRWRRNAVQFNRLNELAGRVRALERHSGFAPVDATDATAPESGPTPSERQENDD